LIIQRLDQIQSLLNQQQIERAEPPVGCSDDLTTIGSPPAALIHGGTSPINDSPLYYNSEPSRLTIETILSWGVFEGKFASGTNLKALILSSTLLQEPFVANADPRLERLDLDLMTCTRLLHTFLEQVHIANPILDVPLVTDYLYQACVHGIGWDAPSCLVVRLSSISWRLLTVFPNGGFMGLVTDAHCSTAAHLRFGRHFRKLSGTP